LRLLFKDEVRRIGNALEIEPLILGRHPFPGPGLGMLGGALVTRAYCCPKRSL